jgi:periplasmic nitrate reductase NapD
MDRDHVRSAVTQGGFVAEETHIAGVLVHAISTSVADVCAQLAALPQIEVHAANEGGKLVVTVEAPDTRALLDQIERISKVPGVLTATLVYQHNESVTSMQEEMNDLHAA